MKCWTNFKVEVLGVIYLFLTAILAVKNNLRISFGFIQQEKTQTQKLLIAKIPLELPSAALWGCLSVGIWEIDLGLPNHKLSSILCETKPVP